MAGERDFGGEITEVAITGVVTGVVRASESEPEGVPRTSDSELEVFTEAESE